MLEFECNQFLTRNRDLINEIFQFIRSSVKRILYFSVNLSITVDFCSDLIDKTRTEDRSINKRWHDIEKKGTGTISLEMARGGHLGILKHGTDIVWMIIAFADPNEQLLCYVQRANMYVNDIQCNKRVCCYVSCDIVCVSRIIENIALEDNGERKWCSCD